MSINFGPVMTSVDVFGSYKKDSVYFSEQFTRAVHSKCSVANPKMFVEGCNIKEFADEGYKQITCDPKTDPIELADFVKNNIGANIQFANLVLPFKAIEYGHNLQIGNVFIRYIEDYLPATDMIAGRYDVLVRKAD